MKPQPTKDTCLTRSLDGKSRSFFSTGIGKMVLESGGFKIKSWKILWVREKEIPAPVLFSQKLPLLTSPVIYPSLAPKLGHLCRAGVRQGTFDVP